MKFTLRNLTIGLVLLQCSNMMPLASAGIDRSALELSHQYQIHCQRPWNINEHLPVLRSLAAECETVVEIGVQTIFSTWGILQGLSESPYPNKSYLGIDVISPPLDRLAYATKLARGNGISFDFWQANDMNIEIGEVDLLFIDSLHTYCHLTYELEKFSPSVRKFIAMHDTSAPWGDMDDNEYLGDYSEYPAEIDRAKRGLWPAVEDFLSRHPEWSLQQRRLNNHGFTVLERTH